MVTFCWCGRPEGYPRCLKEKHKETGKPDRTKGKRFSGDSKFRQEEGQFQAKVR